MVSALILARENRVMINNIKKDVGEIKTCIQKLVNHYSKRLPVWASVIITILGALVTGLVVAAVK